MVVSLEIGYQLRAPAPEPSRPVAGAPSALGVLRARASVGGRAAGGTMASWPWATGISDEVRWSCGGGRGLLIRVPLGGEALLLLKSDGSTPRPKPPRA